MAQKVKNLPEMQGPRFDPWVSKIPWRREWIWLEVVVFQSLKSCTTLCDPMDCRLPYLSLSPKVCSDSCPFSQEYYGTISSSATPFYFCLHSFPASGPFPKSWLFSSDGQSIRTSASASVFPTYIQGWSHLEWTGVLSLLSKGLWRVFSSTTVQRHQFFGT